MHEMSLADGVLKVIEESAKSNHFLKVKTVWLEIGALAGVETEAMRFCFDAAMKNTLAEGARLEIISHEGEGLCLACGKTVTIQQRYDCCPICGGYPVKPTGGMEMRVKELEVE
jgi:hydrogenase nickel incorporation protein HypA/HybF